MLFYFEKYLSFRFRSLALPRVSQSDCLLCFHLFPVTLCIRVYVLPLSCARLFIFVLVCVRSPQPCHSLFIALTIVVIWILFRFLQERDFEL